MVQYVEYLRAKRAVVVVAIILAILLLAAIVVRLIALKSADPQQWVNTIKSSPTARVTTQHLADGSTRTIIDDPAKRTHAVVESKGGYFVITIDEPSSTARDQANHNISIGTLDINENRKSGMSHVRVGYHHEMDIPLGVLFLATLPFGLLAATMLGGALAKENDGHLELAWTKPASRERMALMAAGIDFAAIVIAELLTLAIYLCCILLFGIPTFQTDGATVSAIFIALIAPLAWYAALTAWSASLKSHLGMVIGIGWPAAIIVPAIAHGTENLYGIIGRAVHGVFLVLSYIDPIAYLSFGSGARKQTASIEATLLALVLLTIAYTALSVLQWRRVEA